MSFQLRSFGHVPGLIRRVLLWLLAGYLYAVGMLWYFQDDLILPATRASAGPAALELAGHYVGEVHEPAGTSRATVVYFHGNGGTVSDRSFVWHMLNPLGYRVVLLEYPGYGARPGRARIDEVVAPAIADFDRVRARYPGQPIIVAGESFGAGVAAQVVGARSKEVCGLVVVTPWDRLSELVHEKLPIVPVRALLRTEYASDLALQSYAGPLTIVAAGRDSVIPMHHARELADSHPGAQWVLLPGATHDSWPRMADGSTWKRWLPAGCVN
ncbi:alpha/beta fold hydrolase [Burkholderia multivorans]|jgi:pimeloyl-ACP methyl ester carboxylesterase|nr:alpha/beta fold hydrolase [Burkholderia multivorans]